MPLQRHELLRHALEEQVTTDEAHGHPAHGPLRPVEDAAAVHAGGLLGAEPDAQQGDLLTAEQQAQAGVYPDTLRLSVGTEDPEDLIRDLARALEV